MPCASSATSSARSPAATPSRHAAPERHGALARQRVHEAHRRAALDAVDQHVGERVDLRVVDARAGVAATRWVSCHRLEGGSDAITTA